MKGWTPQAAAQAAGGQKLASERTSPRPAPTEQQTPRTALTASNSAALGLAGVQQWNGVEGQGSVLRFFSLSKEDKAALLAFAAELGIHLVRR